MPASLASTRSAVMLTILTAPGRPELLVDRELPWTIGVLGALVASALAALLVGLATMKLRGDYLAISTFGIAVTIQLIALNWEGLTGGNRHDVHSAPVEQFFCNAVHVLRVLSLSLTPVRGLLPTGLWSGSSALHGGACCALFAKTRARQSPLEKMRRRCASSFCAWIDGDGPRRRALCGFIGFVSPFDFVPIITFQIWTMLIVGGSGNNKGALLGALVVWGLWSASGTLISKVLPAAYQTQGGAVQTILIGLVLVLTLFVQTGWTYRRRADDLATYRHSRARME